MTVSVYRAVLSIVLITLPLLSFAIHRTLQAAPTVLETFEGPIEGWQITRNTTNGGSIQPVGAPLDAGLLAAQLRTNASGGQAFLSKSFTDTTPHLWAERPGTYIWQQSRIYIPSTTLAQLQGTQYLTIARYHFASSAARWELRIRANQQLYVLGTRSDTGEQREFRVYGTMPTDRWIDLEIGLHTQNGPGVKRAFAFLLDGVFYGWYHQGQFNGETSGSASIGIIETNSASQLTLFIDQWYTQTVEQLPSGPDTRSSAQVQSIDYRSLSGTQWQIDWSTWSNDLRLDPSRGLYSETSRLQSGMNIDRLPDLTSGWAEIEIDWPKGTPLLTPSSYFGPMVGFRKEINREENLEIIPIGNGNGTVDLVLEVWVGRPIILSRWPMPQSSIAANSHIPEPGDIIRARWEQVTATSLSIQAFYYDASANRWYSAIAQTVDISVVNSGTAIINYNDGYHRASSLTIDSPSYSIRRFTVGALATFPGENTTITPSVSSTATSTATGTNTSTATSSVTVTTTNTTTASTIATDTSTATPSTTPTKTASPTPTRRSTATLERQEYLPFVRKPTN